MTTGGPRERPGVLLTPHSSLLTALFSLLTSHSLLLRHGPSTPAPRRSPQHHRPRTAGSCHSAAVGQVVAPAAAAADHSFDAPRCLIGTIRRPGAPKDPAHIGAVQAYHACSPTCPAQLRNSDRHEQDDLPAQETASRQGARLPGPNEDEGRPACACCPSGKGTQEAQRLTCS